MLDGIEVDVVGMPAVILHIVDDVLPISSLPKASFLLPKPPLASPLGAFDAPRESRFDQPPTGGEIVVSRRQLPETMQVIGKNDDGRHCEWPFTNRSDESRAQGGNPVDQQRVALTLGKIDRKEIAAARCASA